MAVRPPTPLPPEIKEVFDERAFELETHLGRRKYSESFRLAHDLYILLRDSQPQDGWFHKGYPLHNAGMSLLLQNRAEDAYPFFVQAFIEDSIAEAAGEDVRAEEKPAANVIRFVYGLRAAILHDLFERIRKVAYQQAVIQDPADLLAQVSPPPPPPIQIEIRREPGQYEKPWEERVFIGGSYDLLATLTKIREIVASLGFEPVVAREFKIPADLTHHHSLMLLHDCKYAIFDISKESGQLMEIERTRDYEVKTLVVHQMESFHASAMVKALLTRQGIEVRAYHDIDELPKIIQEFLRGRADE